jgi:hypothetical protein
MITNALRPQEICLQSLFCGGKYEPHSRGSSWGGRAFPFSRKQLAQSVEVSEGLVSVEVSELVGEHLV